MLAAPAPMSSVAKLCLQDDPSHSIEWHAVSVDAYQSLGARPGLQNPAYISSNFRDARRCAQKYFWHTVLMAVAWQEQWQQRLTTKDSPWGIFRSADRRERRKKDVRRPMRFRFVTRCWLLQRIPSWESNFCCDHVDAIMIQLRQCVFFLRK